MLGSTWHVTHMLSHPLSHQGVAPAYSELLSAVSAGPKTFGQRISEGPAFTTFLLKREAAQVVNDFPASDADKEVGPP